MSPGSFVVHQLLAPLLRRPHALLALVAAVALLAFVLFASPNGWTLIHQWMHSLVMHGNIWYLSNPFTTLLAFFLIFTFLSAVSLPGSSVLALGAGAVFGAGIATALITLASSLGATAIFLVARRFGRDRWRQRFPDWWAKVDEGVRKRGIRYLLLLRLAPLIPYAVVNPLMAMTSMRAWTFFWVSAVGMLGGSAAYALAGAGLAFWAQG